MYLTHGSRAGSVEGFGDRHGRRGARGTEDHREVRGIGDSSESLVGQVRSLRRHARAAALAVFAVLALALPAAAQSVTTLVSNAGQSTTSANTGSADRAQAFTTGAAGATLSSVEIISGDNEGDDMAVSLCTVDSSGYPTSSCTALTAPSSFASGTLVFTDPASTTLDATTTYTLLITSPGGQDLRLTDTGSNAEETGAAAGWTIANAYHFKSSSNVWGPTGFGTSFLITIKGTLGTTNTAATGEPAITGTAQVGQTLTAVTTGITDADGLTSPTYTYQWIRVDGTEADIAGENSSTYTLVDADLGKTIKVKVSFTDDASHTETLTSAVTVTAAAAPGSPKNLSATVGVGQVVLVWEPPDSGERVSHYEYRSSAGAMISPGAMWQQVLSSAGTLNQAYYQVVKGLTSGTTHTFQVRAVNPQGGSAPATVTATPISQPSCTIDELGGRRLLWQGQLVAGVQSVSTDGSVSVGNAGGVDPGTLTPDAVTFRSTTYSVTTSTSDDYLNVVLRDEDTVWYPPEEVVDALRLHVCNTPYDFSSATVPDLFAQFSGYRWNGGFNWPPGIERTLRLSLPANNAATGEPVITGTAQAGQELTADASPIMDTDGLPSSFTYQWVRVDADGLSNPADITAATAATYTLTAADAGKKVKVKVSFTDELSGEEEHTSTAYPSSGTVTAASTTAPALLSVTVTSTPRKTTDTYGAREHIEFSMTFDASVTVTGAPTFAFDL